MSHRSSVLFLTSELPYPPNQGMAIRAYNFIKHLKESHRVCLLSLTSAPDARERMDALREVCEHVRAFPAPPRTPADRLRTLLTTRLPDMAMRAYSPEFEQACLRALSEHAYSVVHLESIEMAPYALPAIEARGRHRPRFVFDDLNAEYLLQRRAFETDIRRPASWLGAAYSFVQWKRLARYETKVLETVDATVAVSEWDAKALHALAPRSAVWVVPNGIEVSHYLGYKPTQEEQALVQPSGSRLVFTGKMDFRPNVDAMLWFCDEILPAIRTEVPNVALYIVGQRPAPSVQRLAARPGIVVTGFVPDVRPYIHAADLYVVPMRMGGGTRLKVLEALVMGKALVSTALGCEGYSLTEEVALAETPDRFAETVVQLLRDPRRRSEMGARARAFVAERYDWSRIAPLLQAAYSA